MAVLSAYPDNRRIEAALEQPVVDLLPEDMNDEERNLQADAVEKAIRVNDNYTRGMSYRAPWIDDRTMAYNYKEHRQWPLGEVRGKKKVQITVNKIFPAINRIMSFISKTKLMVAIDGVGPEDLIKGKIVNLLFQNALRRDQTEYKFHECLKDSRIAGLGVGKEIWNWEKDFPFGIPELEVLRSDEIIVEPGAMGMQYEDADWIIHHQRVTIQKLKALYPEYKNQIKPDTEWLEEAERPHWFSAYPAHDMADVHRGGGASLSDISRHPEMATIKEMWYKEYHREIKRFALRQINAILPPNATTIDPGQEIPEGMAEALRLQPEQDFVEIAIVITKIRVSTVINNTLISDRPSPYAHSCYPFVFFKANTLDKYSYPAGDVIFGVEIQDVINKLHSINVDQMVRSNYSPLVTERGALDQKTEEILAKYGMSNSQLLALKRGAKLTRMPPPQGVQEGFLLLLRELSNSFDELMGYHDIDRSEVNRGMSGKGMEQLQLSSDIFHAPKNNPIQQALLWHTKLRLSNMQYLMKNEKAVRIDERLGKQIEGTSHKAFMGGGQPEGGTYTVNKMGLDEQMQPIILNDLSVGEYDLRVSLVSDYAETQRGKAEAALGLKRMDVYDDKAVLDALDDPRTDEILRRKDERNELLQMGQKVAEDPVLMAMMQDPAVRAEVEAYLKAKIEGGGGPAAPIPGQGVSQ